MSGTRESINSSKIFEASARARSESRRVSIRNREELYRARNMNSTRSLTVHTHAPDIYEEAMTMAGNGRFNILALCACCLIYTHAFLEMIAIAYVITPATCDLDLNVNQKSWINSGVFIGVLTTAVCWGILGDQYGRRKIMVPNVIGTILASFFSSMSGSFLSMFLFRLLTGVFVSGTSGMVLVYLSETQPIDNRDRCLVISLASGQFTFTLVPFIAWAFIPTGFHVGKLNGWRFFMWSWGIFGFLGVILLLILPESPRYVFHSDGPDEALKALQRIYAWNTKRKPEEFPIKTLKTHEFVHEDHSLHGRILSLKKNVGEAMKPPLRKCILLSHFAMFVVYMVMNGIYSWVPDMLNGALSRPGESINICNFIQHQYVGHNIPQPSTEPQQVSQQHGCNEEDQVHWTLYPTCVGMELYLMIPHMTVAYLINRVNKLKLFNFIMMLCALNAVLSLLVPQMLVAMFMFLSVQLCCATCCILTSLLVEDCPTVLRGSATCTLYMIGQLGAVLGANVIGWMHGALCYVLMSFIVLLIAGAGLSIRCFWPDSEMVRDILESRGFDY